MVHMIALLHTMDDSGDHDSKINEDTAHAHEALSAGVHGTADEFSHSMLLEKVWPVQAEKPAGIKKYFLLTHRESQGGMSRKVACHSILFCFSSAPWL